MVITSQLSINGINVTNILQKNPVSWLNLGFLFFSFFFFCLKGIFPYFFDVSSLRLPGVVSWCFGLVQSRNDVIHKKRKKNRRDTEQYPYQSTKANQHWFPLHQQTLRLSLMWVWIEIDHHTGDYVPYSLRTVWIYYMCKACACGTALRFIVVIQ